MMRKLDDRMTLTLFYGIFFAATVFLGCLSGAALLQAYKYGDGIVSQKLVANHLPGLTIFNIFDTSPAFVLGGEQYGPIGAMCWWMLNAPVQIGKRTDTAWIDLIVAVVPGVGSLWVLCHLWNLWGRWLTWRRIRAFPKSINRNIGGLRLGNTKDVLRILTINGNFFGIRARPALKGGRREHGSVVVSGLPGSGKSTLLKTWLITCDALSAFVIDLKDELREATGMHRGALGPVAQLDLTTTFGDSIDPLDTDDHATATGVISVFIPVPDRGDTHWAEAAQVILQGVSGGSVWSGPVFLKSSR